jgi:hypothetical protein
MAVLRRVHSDAEETRSRSTRIFPAAVMAVLGQVCTCHDHLSLVLSEPGR